MTDTLLYYWSPKGAIRWRHVTFGYLIHNASKVGLRINREKTKIMSTVTLPSPPIFVRQCPLECVTDFQYLFSYISIHCDTESEIQSRLGKAASVFKRLNPMWSSRSISISIAVILRLYTSVVISTALHACETWKSTARIRNTFDVFHRRCIRKTLGLTMARPHYQWGIDEKNRHADLSETVRTRRLRLTGHVIDLLVQLWIGFQRMAEEKEVVRRWLGTRRKDVLVREDLKGMRVTWRGATRVANNRQLWRNLVAQCPHRDRRT